MSQAKEETEHCAILIQRHRDLEISPWRGENPLWPLGYTYISSITPSAGSKPFKHTWPAGRSSGVGAAAGCGAAAAAAVRYGFWIFHCYLPPDLGHSAGLQIWQTTLSELSLIICMFTTWHFRKKWLKKKTKQKNKASLAGNFLCSAIPSNSLN